MFGEPVENPMSWPIKKLSDVAKVDGTMTKEYEKYADMPHIGIDSIEKNTGILSGYRTVKEDNVISPKYHFGPQHILYSKIRPALNKVAVPEFEGLCSADCYPLLPIDGFCERKFLAHVLRSDYFLRYVLSFSVRSQMPKVNRKQLEGFTFPCPPLELQRKFIVLVDQSDKSKFARLKSQFIEMFGNAQSNEKGWPVMSMKEAAIRLSDGPFGSNLKSEHYRTEGVRVIRLQNICNGYFLDDDKAYVGIEHYEKIKKYTCHAGDIVIGTLGEPNLRACLIPDDIEIAINKADCVHYIPREELLDRQFVCAFINSPATLEMAMGDAHGNTRKRISSGQLAKLPIIIPPMTLQREYATFADQSDKSK